MKTYVVEELLFIIENINKNLSNNIYMYIGAFSQQFFFCFCFMRQIFHFVQYSQSHSISAKCKYNFELNCSIDVTI